MSDSGDDRATVDGASAASQEGGERDATGAGDAKASFDADQHVCMACHGSGKIISNLGGHSRKVTCPWCRGGGERLTGMDAQEFQQEQATAKRR